MLRTRSFTHSLCTYLSEYKQKLTQLKLDGNRLTEFPTEALAKLSHLEILDLSNNQLSEMVLLPLFFGASDSHLAPAHPLSSRAAQNLPKGVKVELKLRAVNLGHNNFKVPRRAALSSALHKA